MEALASAYYSESEEEGEEALNQERSQSQQDGGDEEGSQTRRGVAEGSQEGKEAGNGKEDDTADNEPPAAPFIGPQEPPRVLQHPAALPAKTLPASPVPSPLIRGRYVSKRERAQALAAPSPPPPPHPRPYPVLPAPAAGSVLNAEVPWNIQKKLRQFEDGGFRNQLPKGIFLKLTGHTKAVTAVRWSPTHGSLLASAGMDGIAHIWNVWAEAKQRDARILSSHTAAIKDLQWSQDGSCVLTCGFDQTCRLTDVETGREKQAFEEDQYITAAKFHPFKKDLFLSGGAKGVVRLWDVRTGGVVRDYQKGLGQVMDLDFSKDGKHFATTSDIADRNASDKTIVVWDFESQIPLSNQVYLEAYTCPCVRYHPLERVFVAQSNGNYIALFSANPPFKMNKYKRFESHKVSGYHIQCNFSPDGGLIVSGSSDGRVYIYQFRSTKLLKVLEAHANVCSDVSYHPSMASVIASGGWEGNVCVFW